MTSSVILLTKLFRPKTHRIYLKRVQLYQLLSDNISKTATIVSAGAGYGKSTLLSQWIENIQAVWNNYVAGKNNLEIVLCKVVFALFKGENSSSLNATKLCLAKIKLKIVF